MGLLGRVVHLKVNIPVAPIPWVFEKSFDLLSQPPGRVDQLCRRVSKTPHDLDLRSDHICTKYIATVICYRVFRRCRI